MAVIACVMHVDVVVRYVAGIVGKWPNGPGGFWDGQATLIRRSVLYDDRVQQNKQCLEMIGLDKGAPSKNEGERERGRYGSGGSRFCYIGLAVLGSHETWEGGGARSRRAGSGGATSPCTPPRASRTRERTMPGTGRETGQRGPEQPPGRAVGRRCVQCARSAEFPPTVPIRYICGNI